MSSVPDQVWEICAAPLWRDLHRAFGMDALAALRDRFSAEPGKHRSTLFTLLDALASCGGESPSRGIAIRLSALAPKMHKPSYGERKPIPPGDRAEARILLTASHLLEDESHRGKAFDFLLADRSLDYVRHTLGPALLETPLKGGFPSHSTLASGVLAFARDLLAAEVARPLLPYPD